MVKFRPLLLRHEFSGTSAEPPPKFIHPQHNAGKTESSRLNGLTLERVIIDSSRLKLLARLNKQLPLMFNVLDRAQRPSTVVLLWVLVFMFPLSCPISSLLFFSCFYFLIMSLVPPPHFRETYCFEHLLCLHIVEMNSAPREMNTDSLGRGWSDGKTAGYFKQKKTTQELKPL